MKILGIVCSPRREGNTEIMVREALEAAQQAGAETELVLVADKEIGPCDGCEACREDGACIIDDDMQEVYRQLEEADGVIFGTPVYFINVTAQAKAIIDRTLAFLYTGRLKGKAAAAIVTARQVGAGQVLSLLYTWFTLHRIVPAGGGIGYGREKGEVKDGPGGLTMQTAMKEARTVGRSLVSMTKKLAKAAG